MCSSDLDEGSHDDLVMCLVLFSWMTNQTFFSDLCNTNFKEKLYRDQMKQLEDDMLPLPLSGDEFGHDRLVEDGSVWEIVNN